MTLDERDSLIEYIRNHPRPFTIRHDLIAKIEAMPLESDRPKQRTGAQNNAAHLYFEMLAHELNAAGYDMKKVLKHEVDIEWSKEMVKRYLWKPIQKALYDTDSTAELEKDQVSKVYEHLNRLIGEKCGIHVPFPNEEKNTRLTAMDNLKRTDYPEYTSAPSFD